MHAEKQAPRSTESRARGKAAPSSSETSTHGTGTALLDLQRSAGNSAVVRMVRRAKEPVVQRSSDGEPSYTFDPTMGANPHLSTDFNNNYRIGSGPDPDGYFQVEQFCAYLATYWLTHGHAASGLRFLDLDEGTRRNAADTVRNWASSGGLAAQVQYAQMHVGAASVTRQDVDNDAASGELTRGTLIWFGNDVHAEAAVVTGKGQYLMYDPNTGQATQRDTDGFRAYIASKNAFVVRVGPGADDSACCCIVS